MNQITITIKLDVDLGDAFTGSVVGAVAAITNEQIRDLRRADPQLLDTVMMAIHSEDAGLRASARERCAELLNERNARGKATP